MFFFVDRKRAAPITCCKGIGEFYMIEMIKYGEWPTKYYPVASVRGSYPTLKAFIASCYGLDGTNFTTFYPKGIFELVNKELADNMSDNIVSIFLNKLKFSIFQSSFQSVQKLSSLLGL